MQPGSRERRSLFGSRAAKRATLPNVRRRSSTYQKGVAGPSPTYLVENGVTYPARNRRRSVTKVVNFSLQMGSAKTPADRLGHGAPGISFDLAPWLQLQCARYASAGIVGVLALPQHQPDRRAGQVERLAQRVDQIAPVRIGQLARLGGEEREARRPRVDLGDVA